MGYKQTTPHRYGKGSYHQIGLVRGQFGNVDFFKWLHFLQETGFDGWEEASWELDLRTCAIPAWSCSSSASARCWMPVKNTASPSIWNVIRASARWAIWSRRPIISRRWTRPATAA